MTTVMCKVLALQENSLFTDTYTITIRHRRLIWEKSYHFPKVDRLNSENAWDYLEK